MLRAWGEMTQEGVLAHGSDNASLFGRGSKGPAQPSF